MTVSWTPWRGAGAKGGRGRGEDFGLPQPLRSYGIDLKNTQKFWTRPKLHNTKLCHVIAGGFLDDALLPAAPKHTVVRPLTSAIHTRVRLLMSGSSYFVHTARSLAHAFGVRRPTATGAPATPVAGTAPSLPHSGGSHLMFPDDDSDGGAPHVRAGALQGTGSSHLTFASDDSDDG